MSAGYRWDDFLLDLDAYRLERRGAPIPLEPKALNLLALIVRRPGHLFTKQEIFEAVWPDTAVTDHALTRVVAQLRRALGDEAREARYIETVPTRGYRWLPQVEPVEAASSAPPTLLRVVSPPPVQPAQAKATDASPNTAVDSGTAVGPRAGVVPVRGLRPVFGGFAAALAAATLLLLAAVWLQRADATTAAQTYDGTTNVERNWKPVPVGLPRQLTTHDGLDMQPSLSPQGDAVAYVSDRSGALEIYIRSVGADATETALTSNGGQNVQPAWSPDGRLIAYHSAAHGGIWVVASRGGLPRQIAPIGSKPDWSPDGRRIAFQSDEHTDVTPSAFGAMSGSTIWTVDADGANPRELTRSGAPLGGHAAPTWSASGRFIAFTVFEAGEDNGVWLASVDSGATQLVERGSGLYELAFAPDDSAIYVAGGVPLITRLPFDAVTGKRAGPRSVIPVPGVPGVRGLSVAPDGKRLAFGGLTLSSQIWAQPVDASGAAAGPSRALTTDTSFRKSLPVVSPDGSRVAYMSTRRGETPNVWVMTIDGSQRVPLTSSDTSEFWPGWYRWFPDSRRMAFVAKRGPTRGLWRMDLATRREELIYDFARALGEEDSQLTGQLAEFQLAPSITRAVFSLLTPPLGRRVLYVSAVDAFAPRAVTDGSRSIGYPTWSPDERYVAVEIKDGSSTHAGVVDVATGAVRQLTTEPGQTWVRSWSPDGRRIATAALRAGLWSLQWIDVATGATRVLLPPAPPHVYVRYPDASPRGDLVVYEHGELRGNIWLLNLP